MQMWPELQQWGQWADLTKNDPIHKPPTDQVPAWTLQRAKRAVDLEREAGKLENQSRKLPGETWRETSTAGLTLTTGIRPVNLPQQSGFQGWWAEHEGQSC